MVRDWKGQADVNCLNLSEDTQSACKKWALAKPNLYPLIAGKENRWGDECLGRDPILFLQRGLICICGSSMSMVAPRGAATCKNVCMLQVDSLVDGHHWLVSYRIACEKAVLGAADLRLV
eukprot:scaffold63911_cov67-Cyclotella_meneghiniana.AAC.17